MRGAESWGWFIHVASVELRQRLAYRLEFWTQFIGLAASQIAVAYFLWSAVFAESGTERIEGYSFSMLMFYYLLVPCVERLVRGHETYQISTEIYGGTLSRYLLYPVSFPLYLYAGVLARQSISLLQCGVAIVIFLLCFGVPDDLKIDGLGFLMGLTLCFVASLVSFALMTLIEFLAFWVDAVWTMMVMLRFAYSLLGGGLIPLEFYPIWAREILAFTPFPYFVAVPIRLLIGTASVTEFWNGVLVLGVWGVLFLGMMFWLWRRGTRQYTGVGI